MSAAADWDSRLEPDVHPLVTLTVMCVLTGFQAKWAYDRQAFIASEVLARQVHRRHHIHDWGATLTGRGKNPPAAPGFLWVFGEEGFSSVCVLVEAQNVKALTDHDWDRVQ